MSDFERKGTDEPSEPPPPPKSDPPESGRWRRRIRRICDEAGIYLIRGAATAAGGAMITVTTLWIQARV